MTRAATGQATPGGKASTVADGAVRGALPKPTNFQRFGVLQRKCGCEGPGSAFGECTECKAERGAPLQRASAGTREQGRQSDEVPPIVHEVLRSPGQPLDAATRAFMEPRFEHDFSGVRVHTDARAAEAAASINARAFTSNGGVAFASGEYAPQTVSGRRLLSHELTHVVQQGANAHLGEGVGEEDDVHERQADLVAHRIVREPSARSVFEGSSAENRLSAGAPHAILAQKFSTRPERDPITGEYPSPPWLEGEPFRLPERTWVDIIPDAVLKTGEKPRGEAAGQSTAHGKLTDFGSGKTTYHQAGQKKAAHEIAEAAPLGLETQEHVDAAVDAIKQARAKIHQRFLSKRSTGFMATTGLDAGLATEMGKKTPPASATAEAAARPDWKEGTDASARYSAWLATALPTSVKDAKDPKWLIYKTIVPWEGNAAAINTWDQANVTWGSGFAASGGQVQELTQRIFDKSPEVRDAFFQAGITLDDKKQYVVVDTDRKWKLHDMDAQLFIRTNRDLLSLMINVAQGEFLPQPKDKDSTPKIDPKQAVLDANFENFLAHALSGIPSAILTGWATGEAALAAHAIHGAPGFFNWGVWSSLSPHTATDIGEHVLDKAGNAWFEAIVPSGTRTDVLARKKAAEEKKKKDEAAKAGEKKD